jgi:hypothetical protein
MREFRGVFLLLFLIVSNLDAQILNENAKGEAPIYKHKYQKFLFIPDSSTQASLMSVSYQYLYIPQTQALRAGGTSLNVGLNLARFFSNKFILGICYDLKDFSGSTNQRISKDFVNSFNSAFKSSTASVADSASAYTLRGGLNGTPGYGIHGNTFQNFGVSFSPFPQKYGGVLVQMKIGYRIFPFSSAYPSQLLNSRGDEFVYLQLNKCYSVDICFKPYKFFRSGRVVLNHLKVQEIYKFIVCSLYYEQLNFNAATFNGMPISQMVGHEFISKYSKVNNFGVKFGFALY